MKKMVDLVLNNGEKFHNVEYVGGSDLGTWEEFELKDGKTMHVPVNSIVYAIELENEGEQNESK